MSFEDLVLVYEACCKADSIGVVEEPLYNYRRTTQGGFLASFSEQTLDIVKAFRLVFDFMKKYGYMETYYDELEYICTRHFLYRYPALFKGSNKGKLSIKKEIIIKTQEFLDTELPGWRKNHYLRYSSGALKAKLKLYSNKNRMLHITQIREYTPEFAMRMFIRSRDFAAKWKKRFKKLQKSKNRLSLIKKKLPLFAVLAQSGSVYYTRMYEGLSINPKDILFESKHGEDVAGNIFAMLRELMQDQYKEYRVLLAMEKDYMEQYRQLLENYGIERVTMIDIRSKAYARALASAKYLVTDTSFPTYFIKKKGQIYLNTWHGTPLKAMGRIVPQREYALGNVQRNFLIADYLLYQNDFSKEAFLTDYMIKDIYRGTALVCGYPRNSIFFHKNRYHQIRQELKKEDKQLIAYMPTWRGLLHQKETAKQLEMLGGYFAEIDNKLTDSQILYVKLHPFVKDEMDFTGYKHIREFPVKYETYDFLNATDALVTDYSSIMFDYGVTGKKMILFTYDREEYKGGRGLYFELESLGLPIADTVDELIKELNTTNVSVNENNNTAQSAEINYPWFHQKFCSYDSMNTTRQVVETLLYGKASDSESYKAETTFSTDKKTVLVYIKGLNKDHYTEKLIASINRIPADRYDVYVCMKANNAKKYTQLLSEFNREVKYFPLTADINYTRLDYIISKLYLHLGISLGAKKRIKSVCQREAVKNFDNITFDYVIHHSEPDRMIGGMCSLLGKTTLYNFKHFNMNKYKEDGAYRRQVKTFLRLFPAFTAVIATKEYDLLHKKADNIVYNEDNVFPITKLITEVTQHEGRSNNLSQR
jgi:CDP-glycerol glycerophosphotransferase (TagB/SpsB family)